MTQALLWRDSETFILTRMELYNWGSFQRYHKADIDPAGTSVIGSTGSGKTTLVDALMTLLCANPRYNLASTGGHESDRDLVSYVRGVSGPGDGGAGQSHIARQGKTVTAIAATLERDGQQVRLGALLWFEGTSSTATDMKKLWLFGEAPEQTLEHWLGVHRDGGMRALRQLDKDSTGIWTYPSKKAFLARLRDYFEVSENAFTLLNRAAGLKQLNSIDEIFRELVLDDRSAFGRAAEVASSFDDLTDIHRELEIARRQQRSLQPIADCWERYSAQNQHLQEKKDLDAVLPIWFGEQAHRLWLAETKRLDLAVKNAMAEKQQCEQRLATQRKEVEQQLQRYLQAGGAGIDELKNRIADWEKQFGRKSFQASQYQLLAANLELSGELSAAALLDNQRLVAERLEVLGRDEEAARAEAFDAGLNERGLKEKLSGLQKEKAEVERRPSSNLSGQFQTFRADLAQALGLDESALPFVAELVQVKAEEQNWRGAIERAIGSHRLRILVAPESTQAALRWVNQRHNRLHVRLLEVKSSASRPTFFDDSFTQKLTYKEHIYRKAVEDLLSGIDRHCVDSPDALRHIPHAMTAQGLMSGKDRFFDKQDQKSLEDDWLTGFDNRDRLAFLDEQMASVGVQLKQANQELRSKQDALKRLQDRASALARIRDLEFDEIDLPGAQLQLEELQARLNALTRPDSDIATAKAALDEAKTLLDDFDKQLKRAIESFGGLTGELERAASATRGAWRRAEQGMSDAQRALGTAHFPTLTLEQLGDISDMERKQARELQEQIRAIDERLQKLQGELIKRMSDAKKEDTGALSEVGRELDDVPSYLERLRVLTEEALPEKLKRFLDYLNRSSDDGVTQLLRAIEYEVSLIEERLDDLNATMQRVDFQPGRYLRLIANKFVHESVRSLDRAQRQLNSSRFVDDGGESQYKALQELVALLKDACERNRTLGARALLDPRFRLEFAVSVIDRETGSVIETRTGSQGGSGGEKEIIASYVLTASLSYALCPDGSSRPLFGTIVLDEAFSRSSHAVAGRIIAALKEFGLHAVFITPNKEMKLLRHHTRSAIVVHRLGSESTLTSLSWEELDERHQQRARGRHEVPL
ncbi:ATP-binding protein [Pseudomonas tohonis]|uniref:ATP-binding protein n=1 Tax=Pseudomonas tohonis TaxID=2725477 RepID=UPI0022F0C56A|nr:ATP-binding protein [Pseudomonas tohonis]